MGPRALLDDAEKKKSLHIPGISDFSVFKLLPESLKICVHIFYSNSVQCPDVIFREDVNKFLCLVRLLRCNCTVVALYPAISLFFNSSFVEILKWRGS
jgi:hypothetical protein